MLVIHNLLYIHSSVFYFIFFSLEQEVTFKVDYKVEAIAGREFGSVYLANENLAKLVVQNGWAKVISIFYFISIDGLVSAF